MLTFPSSTTSLFFKEHAQALEKDPEYKHLRLGQAFFNWAKLDKVTNWQDKLWCDKLYNLDGEAARDALLERTDFQQ